MSEGTSVARAPSQPYSSAPKVSRQPRIQPVPACGGTSGDNGRATSARIPGEQPMTRIVIIGGGPAGYEAALVAAQLGAQVTVVERDGIGGGRRVHHRGAAQKPLG